eukprot:3508063-Alexandrium_andersonii.AAC.1
MSISTPLPLPSCNPLLVRVVLELAVCLPGALRDRLEQPTDRARDLVVLRHRNDRPWLAQLVVRP